MLLRHARLLTEPDLVDLLFEGSAITQIGPGLAAPEGAEVVDLEGRLVTAPLVEPHIHLDAVLTVGQPRDNVSGSLFEGIAVWAERTPSLTVEDVTQRAREVLRWQLACGVQHVRSHVDVCDRDLRALRALSAVRDDLRGEIDLQLVAFPQQSVFGFEGGPSLMREAMELGADVVGGIPHYELTREDGVAEVNFVFDLALEFGRPLDLHCD
ncbi:MAG: amidohydrolase family protein, partial [Actinomycetota bacterium]|nr:amidohydrolase family protein [Actinomycetota bacterium]